MLDSPLGLVDNLLTNYKTKYPQILTQPYRIESYLVGKMETSRGNYKYLLNIPCFFTNKATISLSDF